MTFTPSRSSEVFLLHQRDATLSDGSPAELRKRFVIYLDRLTWGNEPGKARMVLA